MPAAGQNLETGQLPHHYIAEILLNVTLNHHKTKLIQHDYLARIGSKFIFGGSSPVVKLLACRVRGLGLHTMISEIGYFLISRIPMTIEISL